MPQEVVVVTGYKGRDVGAALADLPVELQPNLRYEEGQMISVAVGVGALAKATDVVMVCLGDMVLLRTQDYLDLVAAYEAADRVLDRHSVSPRSSAATRSPSR